jgi:hypothetical protein
VAVPRALTPFARLSCFADRLRGLAAGTAAADPAIHRALGLPGEPQAYITEETALWTLLPWGVWHRTIPRARAGPRRGYLGPAWPRRASAARPASHASSAER